MICVLQGCLKDDAMTSGPIDIGFSVDTLHFDTVFTQVGSATRSFKIYNHENSDIILSSVELREGDQSSFRMNVDGIPGQAVSNVRIPEGDSIYIFIEVTIDPDQPVSESPFVIEEYIDVHIEGYSESILVDAWGQNANYIPNRFNKGRVYRLDCDNVAWWDDPKPYVIYGLLYIDSCVLNIVGGTEIYIHGGITRVEDTSGSSRFINDGNIVVGPEGRMVTIGTPDNPVIFSGDRLESEFNNVRGQWGGIRLLPGSTGTTLTGAIIRNSIFGVYVDSLAEVVISKTQIFNTSNAGLIAFHAGNVEVTNSLIHSNSTNSVILSFGGKHNFRYTTLANFGNDREALFMTNHFCYDFPECENWPVNDLDATFVNCIMTGSNRDEVWLSAREEARADVMIDHCIIRVEELLDEDQYPDFLEDFTMSSLNCNSTDSLFADESNYDFHLDSLSKAEGRARPLNAIFNDLENTPRDPQNPDIGCYEYQ